MGALSFLSIVAFGALIKGRYYQSEEGRFGGMRVRGFLKWGSKRLCRWKIRALFVASSRKSLFAKLSRVLVYRRIPGDVYEQFA